MWALLIFLIGFIFCLFIPVIIASPLPVKKRVLYISPAWKLFGYFLLKIGFGTKVFTQDNRTNDEKKLVCVYISNHQSFLDIPLVLTQFQIPPIMKKEILYIPLFGILAWLSGSLMVSRSSQSSRKKTLEKARNRLLTEKLSIQFYPEGTRTKNALPRPLNEIKMPLIKLAYQHNIPVIATSIYGTRQAYEMNKQFAWSKKLAINVAHPIFPQNFQSEEEFVAASWAQVMKGYDELKIRFEN
jgi:1-acyl-sn-glycerol-3-phosphate acyltransferase